MLREARTKLKEMASKSSSIRAAEIDQSASVADAQYDRARAKALRQINKQEASSKTWSTLSFFSASARQALDRIQIPADWPPATTEIEE